ncbi:MAG: hypothetical protein HY394_01410 [Candidatus Diapherotrites archaeon]|nr:hypothetical protein [Candidatus Diapherotrites archaeon]
MEKKFFLLAAALFMAFLAGNAFAAVTCPAPADPSIQLTAGTNFCYYFYVSKGSNSEQGTNYRVDLDLLKGGKAPGTGNAASCTSSADCEINFHCDNGTCKLTLSELYVCVNLGHCVPVSANDVALIDVKAPSIFEGNPITVKLSVYNNNSGPVNLQTEYKFFDTSGTPLTGGTFTPGPSATPVGSISATGLLAFSNVPANQSELTIGSYSYNPPGGLAANKDSYKVQITLKSIVPVDPLAPPANSNPNNDSREAYFSVSKRTSATNIPETNLLLLPALFAVIAFILFRE